MNRIRIKPNRNLPSIKAKEGAGRPEFYPFSKLKIGQSFDFPENCINPHSTVYNANKRHSPKKFTTRTLENGVIACWRIR